MIGKYSLRGWSIGEWIDFLISVGAMWGLFALTLFLSLFSFYKHISIPSIAYMICVGMGIFSIFWIGDSISHHSIFKNVIDSTEKKIHIMMVSFTGMPLLFILVGCYWAPMFLLPLVVAFATMKLTYSLIDEVSEHWGRLRQGKSDMIETICHWGQFIGNIVYDFAWIYWIYALKYAGAKELFVSLGKTIRMLLHMHV